MPSIIVVERLDMAVSKVFLSEPIPQNFFDIIDTNFSKKSFSPGLQVCQYRPEVSKKPTRFGFSTKSCKGKRNDRKREKGDRDKNVGYRDIKI